VASVLVFTQAPEHLVSVFLHVAGVMEPFIELEPPLQAPAEQVSPVLHFLPHEPQCEASVLVFTQAPEHLVSVFLHVAGVMEPFIELEPPLQAPAEQVSPDLHFLPQEPQCEASVLVFTQAPEHLVSVFLHVAGVMEPFIELEPPLHAPAEQVSPVLHFLPHEPQCEASVLVFTQAPEHFVSVFLHVAGVIEPFIELEPPLQAPAAQVSPDLHFLPHEPQCEASVLVLTQEPEHLVSVFLHVAGVMEPFIELEPPLQAPAAQVSPVLHFLPQLPQ